MPAQQSPAKVVISVAEMSEMVGLSRSRFYSLMQSGIFPQPVRNEPCKRPVFTLELQQTCLDVRRTGIGANGQPVLFNRMRKATSRLKPKQAQQPTVTDHADLAEALRSLGQLASNDAIDAALRELFPDGWSAIEQPELVRRLFLKLRTK